MEGVPDAIQEIVVIGAGHAAGLVATQLRQNGYGGGMTLIGDEPELPYQRPPLSKAWLAGQASAEQLHLKPKSYYDSQAIQLLTGVAATAIDRARRLVTLQDGRQLGYDRLVLATGASARPWPGGGNFLSLRSIRDATLLQQALQPGTRLAIIGGGYIGLEVAASASGLGCHSIILEREPRLLARVAGETLSAYFLDTHRARGIEIHLAARVQGIDSDASGARIRLADGQVIACDRVLIGIGALANDRLARAAGLACDNGVLVDERAQSSDPEIFAIGDVAVRPLPLYDRQGRLESVPNAMEQARIVAAVITGRPLPPHEVPWFWSDQFGLKLQIAGLIEGADDTVRRGDPDADQFAVFHLRQGRLLAVEAVNAVPEFMAGKSLIGRRSVVDPARLGNMAISMKDMLG